MHPGECLCRDQEVWDFGTINIMTELVSQWGPTLTAFTDTSCSSIVVYFFFFWVMTLISSAVGTSAFHPVRNQMNVSSWPDHNWTQMNFPGCFFFFFLVTHLAGVHTEQRNMTGFLLKCAAAFGKSCQCFPFGLEPALNYWIHHA